LLPLKGSIDDLMKQMRESLGAILRRKVLLGMRRS
jgi:hypothetical protein